MASQSYPYTTSGNYTFDSDLIEVTGGVARLKDQRPANATFAATYTTNINGNWGDGVLTGTAVGGAAVSAGKLDCTGGTVKYVSYAGDGNADFTNTVTFRFKVTPQYSGSPAANRAFIGVADSVGSNNNFIRLLHLSSGQIQSTVRDSTGGVIFATNFGAWSPTASQEYEICYCLDTTTGASRLFIDGVQLGATQTGTGTRTDTIGIIHVGCDPSGTVAADYLIDDFLIHDTVLFTSNYTPGYTVPETIYSTANPTILTNSSIDASNLLTFVDTTIQSGSDLIKWVISVGGTDYWSNSGTVETSNGTYSQANTEAEVQAVIENFVNSKQAVKFKAFLHSDDGSTFPQLDQLDITFDSVLPAPTLNTIVDVDGYLYGADGTVFAGKTIKARPYAQGRPINGVFVSHEYVTLGNTESDGFLDTSLMYLDGEDTELKIGDQNYRITVQDTATADWSTFTFTLVEDA